MTNSPDQKGGTTETPLAVICKLERTTGGFVHHALMKLKLLGPRRPLNASTLGIGRYNYYNLLKIIDIITKIYAWRAADWRKKALNISDRVSRRLAVDLWAAVVLNFPPAWISGHGLPEGIAGRWCPACYDTATAKSSA